MHYRNIQGLRAAAALMAFCRHLFWDIATMRMHRAKPWVMAIGISSGDIFSVISGLIIYHVVRRSAALLTPLMAIIGLGAGLLSYHFLERPLLRVFRAGRHALARGPDRVTHASHSPT